MTQSAITAADDAAARERIATALDVTLVVEAAAGTGKTTELIRRILNVLASGRAVVESLVVVTFTEKAAGELKLRLRQELEIARQAYADPSLGAEPVDRVMRGRRLERALQSLEDAHVSTIHGFCADLLRERPVEAGIDPLFTVLTEPQARAAFAEAFQTWFHSALEEMPDGVRRSLRRSSRPGAGGEADMDGPVDRLHGAAWSLADWRDFPQPWSRPEFNRADEIAALTRAVHELAQLTAQPSSARDYLHLDTAAARRADEELQLLVAANDLDAAEAVLVDLCRDRDFRRARKGSGAAFSRSVPRQAVLSTHQALVQELDRFRALADADLAAHLREELRGCIAEYERVKQRRGALDFLDLLLRARDLVRDRDDVRADFQTRFAALFVDEFQDTDPLQAELLLLLAADDPAERRWTHVRPVPGKLFIVGDPKQSIYRFRRADVGIYQDVCDQLTRQGATRLYLTRSFRSLPNIQNIVNAAFAPLMTGDRDTLQASYVPLAPSRAAFAEQPSVIALPVPSPYGRRNISGMAIEQSLPDAVSAFIAWLVTGGHDGATRAGVAAPHGWRVIDRRSAGAAIPIEPRHICILFRRFVNFGTDVTRPYLDALEARGIHHLLVGGRAFHGREEIETLRAALAAIEWPDDELSVFATLRGALFAISDVDLLEYHHAYAHSFHPFRLPPTLPTHLEPIGDALRLLTDLHRWRNRRPVADTVSRLFAATRAHVGFALRPTGEQVLANVLHVAELARQYELSGGISFRGFVDTLRDAADDGNAAEAPIVEDGSDGVRLMTVHKAKGLEFPVVILADITAKLAPLEASRHLAPERELCALRIGGWSPWDLLQMQAIEQAREKEEGIRVAYVAATRARDLLVIPAVGDEPYEGGWVSPLDAAIYPPLERRRVPEPAQASPPFRKDSVLERPDMATALPKTVAPGRHRWSPHDIGHAAAASSSPCDVVWWDPAALNLGVEAPFGLRRQELIARDVEPEVISAGERRYRDWSARRSAALSSGGEASLRVMTTTEWSRLEADSARNKPPGAAPTSIEVVAFDSRPGRPAGVRYGALVHAVLAALPLDVQSDAVAAIVATEGRIVGASEDEVASATEVVHEVIAHPLLRAARDADHQGRCFRETPVTMMHDGLLIEGNVDLAFEQDGAMIVIDFKTDRPDGERLRHYERQVALYAGAITQATGLPSRAILMKV